MAKLDLQHLAQPNSNGAIETASAHWPEHLQRQASRTMGYEGGCSIPLSAVSTHRGFEFTARTLHWDRLGAVSWWHSLTGHAEGGHVLPWALANEPCRVVHRILTIHSSLVSCCPPIVCLACSPDFPPPPSSASSLLFFARSCLLVCPPDTAVSLARSVCKLHPASSWLLVVRRSGPVRSRSSGLHRLGTAKNRSFLWASSLSTLRYVCFHAYRTGPRAACATTAVPLRVDWTARGLRIVRMSRSPPPA